MRSLLLGTLTLRTATGTTGALLIVWNKYLHTNGVVSITPVDLATITLAFYVTELIGSPIFGIVADRIGRKPVMLLGPLFGLAAVLLTPFAATIPLLVATRLLEGASTAASVPSILSFVAAKTSHDEKLRGRVVTLFEVATLGGLLVWRAVTFTLASGRTIQPLDATFVLLCGGPRGSVGDVVSCRGHRRRSRGRRGAGRSPGARRTRGSRRR